MTLHRLVYFVCLVFLSLGNSYANENSTSTDVNSDDEDSGRLAGVTTLVDETHDKFSDQFSRFIVGIDDFISSGETEKQANESWARIRLDTVKPGADKAKLSGTVKLRAVLPQSQQRFRLLLSSEDDASNAANSDAAQREQIASADSNDVAFALRFIRNAQSKFRLKYDLGARYKDDKAQIFGRFIANYKHNSILGVTHSITNNFTYFSSSGYQNSFRVDTRRNFFDKERLFFRNTLEFSWKEGLKGAGIGETIGIYANLGDRRALALEGITGYSTALNPGETDRYRGAEVRLRFRHSVWRPWFYYEIWPSVSWSSSNDYERAFGGLFRLEVTFGSI